jgi:steroid delta-isomerase-like uncharacterized protein
MSSENKLLAKRWFEEVWNRRQTESIEEMLAEDAVAHGLGEAESPLRGTEGFTAFHKAFLNAFPDLKVTTEDFIAEDHKVAIRWRITGTLQGDGLGIQPSQRSMAVTGMSIVYVRGGKIVEAWNNFDVLGMHQQLGTLSQLLG